MALVIGLRYDRQKSSTYNCKDCASTLQLHVTEYLHGGELGLRCAVKVQHTLDLEGLE